MDENKGTTFEKKMAPNDNYNNNRCEPLFTPHFSSYKANTMTDSYIRLTVHC